MMSSTIPSAKYSCSVSPDMFGNGSTAIEGLSGSAGGWLDAAAAFCGHGDAGPYGTRQPRIGSAIFLSVCEPMSSRAISILPRIWPSCVMRNADTSRLCDPFQTRRDVDAVTKDVVLFDDDIPDVNADAEFDPCPAARRYFGRPCPRGLPSAHRTASTTLANSPVAPSPVS